MNKHVQKTDGSLGVPVVRLSQVSTLLPRIDFQTRSGSRRLKKFIAVLFLVVPTLLAFLYFKLLAVPMYASEVRFFVGGAAEAGGAMGMVKLIPGNLSGGGSTSLIDGFAVRDYLTSYEALEKLDQTVRFSARMNVENPDPYYQLPANATREQRLAFYRSMVQPHFNLTEGIVSATVFSFRPKDSFEVATAVRGLAEDFANEMNRRALEGSIQFAQSEVEHAQNKLAEARGALDKWRKVNANLNPETNAKMISEIIAQLEAKSVELHASIVEMKVAAENSPQRAALETKLKVINEQIAIEKRRLTATDQDASVVNQLEEYQRLVINQEFAAKGYEAALAALQGTRVAAGFKQKYVLTVVAPTVPQSYAYPRIWKALGLVLLVSILSYFLTTLVYSVIRDSHRH